jgi:tetratricopeptide (TPR) repeat protein
MNKWTRPFELSRASAGPAAGASTLHDHYYFAFLSYSHEDSADADWLHEELEGFRVPATLAGKLTANGVIPKRLAPIFRDQHDLAASQDLTEEIRLGLTASRALIVLCSPAAAKSKWVNAEIDGFKRLHPDGCIVAAVIGGEPLACNIPGREGEECFPPALLQKYNRRGQPTAQKAEPLAADLRDGKGGRRTGFLKIVAGILGVGLDDLVQREHLRRQRRLALITAASLIGMLVAIGLAFAAIEARDAARDQRRQAESLVEFMVGDLKDKLEPIGRLDVLDGVGSRVLQYYQQQDTSDLSDRALAQRSTALSLMAQVALSRGNSDRALQLYRQAMLGTAEAMRRSPDDPQRIFDHAQNVFWVGDIARQRGQISEAETAFRDYKQLADQMVAIQPDNLKWRMELVYANEDLGIVLLSERRFPEATRQFEIALGPIESAVAIDGSNVTYQHEYSNLLGWIADARFAEGELDGAIAIRERQVAFLRQHVGLQSDDVRLRQRLVPAEQGLGILFAMRGHLEQGLQHIEAAVAMANGLVQIEPTNSLWKRYSGAAGLSLARVQFAAGQRDQAARNAATSCGLIASLRGLVEQWVALQGNCLSLRAKLALASGQVDDARALAQQALAVARQGGGDDAIDQRYSIASAYRLLGDVDQRSGDGGSAARSWSAGLAALPAQGAEKPSESYERAELLRRLGRDKEARPISAQLSRTKFYSLS